MMQVIVAAVCFAFDCLKCFFYESLGGVVCFCCVFQCVVLLCD